jgi:GntR family transcriptional regulator, transcriptional repressor for pyruvate dehydrogenase complex
MIQFTSRVDKITADFQEQILQGKLKPGERLPAERSLCSVFGVGRTTIREALKALIVGGIVIRRGRSVLVADPENIARPSPDIADLAVQVSIRQLYEIRKLIEVRVAGWAAQRATAEDVAALRRSLGPANPNRAFHDTLAEAVHNPALTRIYECGRQLFFRLPFYWKLFDETEVLAVRTRRHEMARRWHEHVLDAISQHDVAEAEGAMFQHLDIMEKDLLARLPVADGEAADRKLYTHPLLAQLEVGDEQARLAQTLPASRQRRSNKIR